MSWDIASIFAFGRKNMFWITMGLSYAESSFIYFWKTMKIIYNQRRVQWNHRHFSSFSRLGAMAKKTQGGNFLTSVYSKLVPIVPEGCAPEKYGNG